jgi:hypothetical protein
MSPLFDNFIPEIFLEFCYIKLRLHAFFDDVQTFPKKKKKTTRTLLVDETPTA